MAHPSSPLQEVNPLSPLLDKRKLSRRTFLRNVAGLALAGGSLTPLATACGLAPSTSPASQPTASHALGTTIFTYRGHSRGVHAVAWSPDGKRIASGSDDETAQVWDEGNGGHVYTYRGHHGPVNAVTWSPDGKRIASTSDDRTVQVWDAADGRHTYTYSGHTDAVKALAWSPDGRRIASGGDDSTVQVWDAATGEHVLKYSRHTAGVTSLA